MTYFTKPPNTINLTELQLLIQSLRNELVAVGALAAVLPLPAITSNVGFTSFVIGDAAGTVLITLSALPAGATRTVLPADGRVTLSSDKSKLLIGVNPASARTTLYTMTDSKANATDVTLTVAILVTAAIPTHATNFSIGLTTQTINVGSTLTVLFTTDANLPWSANEILTPTISGITGTFNPAVLNVINTHPSIVFTATSAGQGIIDATSSSGIASTGGQYFTANAVVASSSTTSVRLALGGQSSNVGSPVNVLFLNTPNGSTWLANETLTPTITGITGTFDPPVLHPTGNGFASSNFIPTSAGSGSIGVTTSSGIPNSGSQNFTANAVVSPPPTTGNFPLLFTGVAGPATGNQAQYNISPNNAATTYQIDGNGSLIVTPYGFQYADSINQFRNLGVVPDGQYKFNLSDTSTINDIVIICRSNLAGTELLRFKWHKAQGNIEIQSISPRKYTPDNFVTVFPVSSIKVVLLGAAIKIYADDILMYDKVTDGDVVTPGYIGFAVQGGTCKLNSITYLSTAQAAVEQSAVDLAKFLAGNPVINPGADGFPIGIYGPTTIPVGNNSNNEARVASWFARLPTNGAQRWTLTGDIPTVANIFLRDPVPTLGYYYTPAIGTYTGVLTCTDGISTQTKNITAVVTARGVLIGANYMLNTSVRDYTYGSEFIGHIPNVGHMRWSLGVGYDSTPFTFTDPNGFMVVDNGGFTGLASTDAASPLSSHYGHYTGAQFHLPSLSLNQDYEYWIAQEQPAGITVTNVPTYDYAVAGDVFGQMTATSDAGIAQYLIVTSDDKFNIGSTGIISHAVTPVAGTNKKLRVRTISNNGVTTDIVHTYDVGVGIVLPANNILINIAQNLTNGVKNQIVGNATISGFTGGTWTLDNKDTLLSPTYATGPMRLLDVDQTGKVFSPNLLAARADGHNFRLTYKNGANVCIANLNVPCSWHPGPTYYVGRGMATLHGANGFEHMQDLMPRFINNGTGISPEAVGAIIKVAYDSDPNYYADDNGNGYGHLPNNYSLHYGWTGPARIEALDKTQPRPRMGGEIGSPSGGCDQGGKGYFNFNNGDFILDHIEVSHVNGYGTPDGDNSHGVSGVRVNADSYGDFSAYDCAFTDCNNGVESGEGPKRNTIDHCVNFNNGTGTVSAGHTHGYYLGGMELIFTNNLVYKCGIGHNLKTRSNTGTITNNRFYDGERGTASEQINIPQGGKYLVANNDFHKGANPQNPFCIGYLEDDYGRNRVDVLTVNNNRFYMTVPDGMNATPGYAVAHFGKLSTIDGAQSNVIMDNNSYYLPSGAGHFSMQNHAPGHTITYTETNPIVLTAPFALDFTDPGLIPVARPGFFNFIFDDEGGNSMPNSFCAQQDPGVEHVVINGTSPIGTIVLPHITGYGANLYKNDSLTDPRINPFIAGTTWAISQDTTSYGGRGFAPVGRYIITPSSDGTSAVVTTGTTLPNITGVDYIKIRMTALAGEVSDWRYYIQIIAA